MAMFNELEEYLNTGDPVVREWFLIKSNFWPISLCTVYLLTIRLGQAIMRDRKPFELRKTMIPYNAFLVATYTTTVSTVIYCMWHTEKIVFCKNTVITRENYTYTIATCLWIFYLLKYVEFLDTILFILRKKNERITKLHVIHHFILPFCVWFIARTERSGFMVFPILINSMLHIVMYSYYGLSAMGPSVRKYLWWKRYLTIAQMVQFIVNVFLITVVMPLAGCTSAKTSTYINIFTSLIFFILFYNFYQHSFKCTKSATTNEVQKPMNRTSHVKENVKCK